MAGGSFPSKVLFSLFPEPPPALVPISAALFDYFRQLLETRPGAVFPMRACRTSHPERCSPSVRLTAPLASYLWLHSAWGVRAEHRALFLASLLWERNDPSAPLCFLPASHQGPLGPPCRAPEAFFLIYSLMMCDQEKPFTELPPSPGVSQELHQAHPSTFFGPKDRSAIPGWWCHLYDGNFRDAL